MPPDDNILTEAITELTPKLLNTMEAIEQVQKNLHPSRLDRLANFIRPWADELQSSFDRFQSLDFPGEIEAFIDRLRQGTIYVLRACDGFTRHEGDTFATMKALRAQSRAQENLYPLASILPPVSQYFLEAGARNHAPLLDALNQDRPGKPVGIMKADNERDQRGGFSLYVPEYHDPSTAIPLVIALHGGTGHGADFIWSWLREARTRGFALLAPTSVMDTWSLMGEEHDLANLLAMLDLVRKQIRIDEAHVLLTGMSDGGTYTLMAGLQADSPFTHLASFSGVLHPEIGMSGRMQYARGRKIYLVHGTLDWMFPIEAAYMARSELTAAGAELSFHPVEGLSHTYCRQQNPEVLSWFHPSLEIPGDD